MPAIVSIVGRSESGKTTLIEKLIPVLTQRGYRIGTIKHTHHAIDIDRSGKDSARHRTAGAETVMLASPGRIAMFKATASEALDGLIRYFDDLDLLITEGYKRENKPKIEVLRAAVGTELLCRHGCRGHRTPVPPCPRARSGCHRCEPGRPRAGLPTKRSCVHR